MRKLPILFIIISLLALLLTGCGESSEAKSKRLKKEADEANQRYIEARDNYNQLKKDIDIIEKYQKSGN